MNLNISYCGETRSHDKHWQFCVGSCHAPMAQRADYLEQLKFVHDELGIERVRFHGLFNDDMKVGMSLKNFMPVPYAGKFKEYSFFQIAKIYDNILKTGMRPFVELGFMPKTLASGKRKCTFEYKGNITMPKDLDEWSGFIKQFIEFLTDRYGADEVSNWYFEVWNEPNLPVFFAGTQKDYFRLYAATVKAIKSVNPKIKVGGPSSANCAWIGDFVKYCKSNDLPCDFLSTHQYAGDPIGHVLRIGELLKEGKRRLSNLKNSEGGSVLEGARMLLPDDSEQITDRDVFVENLEHITPETQGIPLYYTEWNVSATCTAKINDTRRAASYAVRTVLATEGKVAGTSWWTFSDLFEEIQFFPDPFSGAFGMINNYGIPKPSFYAFKMLSMLGDERLVLPDRHAEPVEIAAFKKGDIRQVLLYKQNFFADNGNEDICSVQVDGFEATKAYAYKIDETHCNPLAVWQSLGSPKYLKPQDVEFIKSKSSLQKEEIPFEGKDGKTVVSAALHNNDVYLIELI